MIMSIMKNWMNLRENIILEIKREYNTISKVKSKEWSDSFKQKAIDTYYEFRDYGYEPTDHFLGRFLNRKNTNLTFEKIIEILKKPVNFIVNENEHNVRYYNLIRVITNKKDIEKDKIASKEWRRNDIWK